MMGQTSGLEKKVKCTAAIATAFLIAKFGADDDTLSQAAAATDNLCGIFQHITTAAGEAIRVMLDGISRIKLGDTVTRGGPVTSDSAGKGVPAVGGQNIIGFALASGVVGDIIPVLIAPMVLAAAAGVNGHSYMRVATAIIDVTGGKAVGGPYGLGVTLPDDAIIHHAYGEIKTAFVSTSNDGTIAIGSEDQDNDLLIAVDADTLSGIFVLIPVGTAATAIKLTAARELCYTVAVHGLLSGKAVIYVFYVQGI
jgi:hypothetical protein